MTLIKIWCEYDIGGSFGGNNNEDVLDVSQVEGDLHQVLIDYLCGACGDLEPEELDGLWGFEFITPGVLGV